MRVVLDVNVWISGLLWSGAPSHIMRLAQYQKIAVYGSELLLEELKDTLSLDKFQKRIQAKLQSVEILMSVVKQLCTLVSISNLEVPELRDSDDAIILATGLAAKAEFIITGDQDLLVLGEFSGITVLTPRDFLDVYGPHTDWR